MRRCRSLSASAYPSRPWSLARYMAASASRMSASGSVACSARDGDADARGHHDLGVAQEERRPQGLEQALGHLHRTGLVLDLLAQDDELVAAEAAHRVVAPHRLAEPVRHLLEQAVAGGVAEAVVDHLELVEVDEQHGRPRVVAGRAGQRLLDAVEQEGAVRQPGEAVVHRLVLEAGLGPAPLYRDGGEVPAPLEHLQLVRARAAGLGVEDGDRAEQLVDTRQRHRQRPAAHQPVRRHDVVAKGPARVGRDVLEHDQLGVRHPQRPAELGLGVAVVEEQHDLGREGRRRVVADDAVGLEHAHRAAGAFDGALDEAGDAFEHDLDGHAAGDRLEQHGLLAAQRFRRGQLGDVAADDDDPPDVGVVEAVREDDVDAPAAAVGAAHPELHRGAQRPPRITASTAATASSSRLSTMSRKLRPTSSSGRSPARRSVDGLA